MSATSVLSSFSPSVMPGPVMPMEVAMRFYLSHSPPPLRGFLSPFDDLHCAKKPASRSLGQSQNQQLYKPLRPCLSSQQKSVDQQCCDGWASKSMKKKVVFADSKGMSLTAIHTFSKFDDEMDGKKNVDELQFDMTDLEAATMDLKISPVRSLVLDFKQPSADYLDFRNRLIQNMVCLENCSLQERSLTGTIKVRNIGFEKAVQVRVTYDTWVSFTDVDCTFMNNIYGCQDVDTFAFVVDLPSYIPPHNRVEFCLCFRVQGQTYWDNNDGKNYVLKHVGVNGESLEGSTFAPFEQKPPALKNHDLKVLEMDFDQFGSPRMSSGLFPGWQSWGRIDNTVPYW